MTGTSGLQLHSCWIHGPFREGLPSRGNLVCWSAGAGGIRVKLLLRIRTVVHVMSTTLPPMIKQAQLERERPPSRLQPCMNWMDGRNGFCFLLSCPAPVPRCCHGPGVGLSESSGRWDEGLRGPRPPCCAAPSLPTPAGVRQCCFDVSAVKPVSGWPPSGPSPCSAPSRPLAFG